MHPSTNDAADTESHLKRMTTPARLIGPKVPVTQMKVDASLRRNDKMRRNFRDADLGGLDLDLDPAASKARLQRFSELCEEIPTEGLDRLQLQVEDARERAESQRLNSSSSSSTDIGNGALDRARQMDTIEL